MSREKDELEILKNEVRNFFYHLEEIGVIEETGQSYRKVQINSVFDNDKQVIYTILEKLKTLSK